MDDMSCDLRRVLAQEDKENSKTEICFFSVYLASGWHN
jgi:hypothetical protein